MNVRIIKLTSGEEIISKVENKDGVLCCSKPIVLIFTQQGVGMMPFMPSAQEDKVEINMTHVIATGTPEQQIIDAYTRETSSIIAATPEQTQNLRIHQ